jgi:hypothetical protein
MFICISIIFLSFNSEPDSTGPEPQCDTTPLEEPLLQESDAASIFLTKE